jgi:hypothetical protein
MAWVPYVPLNDRYLHPIYLSYISYLLLWATISWPSLSHPYQFSFWFVYFASALSTGSAGWKVWKQKYSLLAAPSEGQFYSIYFNTPLTIHTWGIRVLLLSVIYLCGMLASSKWSHVGNFIFLTCSSILIFHIWQVCAEASQNWASQEVWLLHAM